MAKPRPTPRIKWRLASKPVPGAIACASVPALDNACHDRGIEISPPSARTSSKETVRFLGRKRENNRIRRGIIFFTGDLEEGFYNGKIMR